MTLSSAPSALRSPDTTESANPQILGVTISAVNVETAVERVLGWVERRDRHYVTVTGVHGVVEAQGDATFKGILNGAGLAVPDGMPMVWLARLAGYSQVSRVFGPDFMLALTHALAKKRRRVFYYGGASGIADELASAMRSKFPGIVDAGTCTPPYRELTSAEREEMIRLINTARPDVVWVGLSTPKQEKWMEQKRPFLDAPALIGVGAAFDYNTGRVKRAPRWMQLSGLEWLYRTIQEPRRLWKRYARNNTLFIYYLLLQKLRLRNFGDPVSPQ